MFVIKNTKTGTYYKCDTAIGPSMGATLEQAHRFKTSEEAVRKLTSHSFAYAFCEVVLAPPVPQKQGAGAPRRPSRKKKPS